MDFSSFDRTTKTMGKSADGFSDHINSQLEGAQQAHEERLSVMVEAYKATGLTVSQQILQNTRRNVHLKTSKPVSDCYEPDLLEDEPRYRIPGFVWLATLGFALVVPLVGLAALLGLILLQRALA
ncbi:MAG: hypothetical protein AAFP09_00955 [Cyanobacteria bacterium J06607_10]